MRKRMSFMRFFRNALNISNNERESPYWNTLKYHVSSCFPFFGWKGQNVLKIPWYTPPNIQGGTESHLHMLHMCKEGRLCQRAKRPRAAWLTHCQPAASSTTSAWSSAWTSTWRILGIDKSVARSAAGRTKLGAFVTIDQAGPKELRSSTYLTKRTVTLTG